MSELSELMYFIGWCFGLVFECLDSVYIGGHSYLNILIALIFLRIVLWFIFRILGFTIFSDSDTPVSPEYEPYGKDYGHYRASMRYNRWQKEKGSKYREPGRFKRL